MASTTSGGPGTIAVFSGPFAELRDFDYFLEFAIRSRLVLEYSAVKSIRLYVLVAQLQTYA